MPQVIEYIDALARQKKRGVLFIRFSSLAAETSKGMAQGHASLAVRKAVIAWLDRNGIGWSPCGPVADPNRIVAYDGRIYVDIPFVEADPMYCLLRDFMENPDGSMAHAGADFYYYPLSAALENSHHDDPGFWERWAEAF